MKSLHFKLMVAFLIWLPASQLLAQVNGGTYACSDNSMTQREIERYPDSQRTPVFNEQRQIIGALVFDPTTENQDINLLFLCGANANFYYVKYSYLEELLKNPEQANLRIFHDEYDVSVTEKSFRLLETNGQEQQAVAIRLSIQFDGEPEDADYSAFEDVIYIF